MPGQLGTPSRAWAGSSTLAVGSFPKNPFHLSAERVSRIRPKRRNAAVEFHLME